jgi:hypothetical protein
MKKRYIKEGNIYFTPIQIPKEVEYIEKEKNENGEEIEIKKTKKVIQYTNVEKDILEAGYKVYEAPKTSVDILVMRSNDKINKQTDNKILNDFTWNDNEFYLSMENQFNFKTLYDLRDEKEYPITIKTKTGFALLEDKFELSEFYLSGVQFVENCLKEGWQKKLDAEEEIRKNYK